MSRQDSASVGWRTPSQARLIRSEDESTRQGQVEKMIYGQQKEILHRCQKAGVGRETTELLREGKKGPVI